MPCTILEVIDTSTELPTNEINDYTVVIGACVAVFILMSMVKR